MRTEHFPLSLLLLSSPCSFCVATDGRSATQPLHPHHPSTTQLHGMLAPWPVAGRQRPAKKPVRPAAGASLVSNAPTSCFCSSYPLLLFLSVFLIRLALTFFSCLTFLSLLLLFISCVHTATPPHTAQCRRTRAAAAAMAPRGTHLCT